MVVVGVQWVVVSLFGRNGCYGGVMGCRRLFMVVFFLISCKRLGHGCNNVGYGIWLQKVVIRCIWMPFGCRRFSKVTFSSTSG